MNSNIFFAFFVSISVHSCLFFLPCYPFGATPLESNVIKGPASIEVSLVQTITAVEVRAVPIKEEVEIEDANEKSPDIREKQPEEIKGQTPPASIGAITEEVADLLVNKPPVYPNLARIKGWEGEVILLVDVDKSGRVTDTGVLSGSGYYILDAAAIRAVKEWCFRNIRNQAQIKIPIKFILTQK